MCLEIAIVDLDRRSGPKKREIERVESDSCDFSPIKHKEFRNDDSSSGDDDSSSSDDDSSSSDDDSNSVSSGKTEKEDISKPQAAGRENREIRANPEIGCSFLKNLCRWNSHSEQSLGLLLYPEQSSRLFCVKITKLHFLLPFLFQLVHLPSNATPDLSAVTRHDTGRNGMGKPCLTSCVLKIVTEDVKTPRGTPPADKTQRGSISEILSGVPPKQ
ncbi:hypothetical protein F2Q68_00015394 [Brassica cretica]|uniref:Uncharacterized protein n=1 Tax=Brassica cretica TaxID=69181 RepID=A0A8S9HI08_BRACR|nr:hypothetical protein F2Q68_00015394 [Brassica cretica]